MGKGPANLKVEAGCRISGYLLYLGFSELPVLYLGKNRNVRVEADIHGYEYFLFICSEQYIYSWAAIYTVYLYSIFSMAIYRTGFAVLEPN